MDRETIVSYLAQVKGLEILCLKMRKSWGAECIINNKYIDAVKSLQDLYNLNIIPTTHRNASSVCYLLDLMTTSTCSLEEALYSLDNKRRIDEMIDRLQLIIDDLDKSTDN